MGQKANPTGLRLGINQEWDSCWYSKKSKFATVLSEDFKIRKFLKKYPEIAKVKIKRAAQQIILELQTAKPGKLIGKQGKGIEEIQREISQTILKSTDKSIKVNIFEIKSPDTNARLAAVSVAQQLEKRISFRRAMKKVMQQAMKGGAKGVKVRVSGRLNGADMARSEWYMEGRVPLHTLRANIDYGTCEAQTTYGKIGVKVWLFKGEVYGKNTNPNLVRNEE